jgi:excisionase family DNA binding protein
MQPLLVSIPDAAKLLSVSRTAIYQLVSSGELASLTIGRRRLIPVSALRSLAGVPADTPVSLDDGPLRPPTEEPTRSSLPPLQEQGTYVVTVRRLGDAEVAALAGALGGRVTRTGVWRAP